MTAITSKIQFDNAASKLAGRMVAAQWDKKGAMEAAEEVSAFVESLPKMIKNCPSCKREISAITKMASGILNA